ncbi:solute carrier family 35 member B1 isoform X2 [Apis cerana]|uniref:solute carrier family 35 member B1 isoform X2 n=1 Tax=Apis cerana TaxID=7461 RepID=UPI00109BB394|nr:solute carrier family 35 member B1 isoform X2 [Apis cerana]
MTSTKQFKLLFCALGIFVCYFHFVFFQCLVNYLFAKTSLLTIMKQDEDTTPKTYYALSALTYLLAMVCSNMALQFVSYPTQVIGKAGKPIPVMILGVLLGNKVYPVRKYLFVFLVVIGVALFMYKDVNPLKKHSEGQTVIGELLLLLSLTMDGLTSAVQERMKSEHNSKSGHMMLNMNGWSVIFSGIVIIASGELLEFVEFLHKYPSTIWHIATFSIAGAFGQYFIFLTVAEFGPLPCSIITTTRKFFTVLGSILIFGNSLTSKQWMGTLIVFSGLFLDSMYGKDKSLRKDTTK